MIKFHTVGQIEKKYYFEDAVTDKDIVNGAFGDVDSDKKFAVSANASKAVMQVEAGDDAGIDEYKIPAGSHVRVVDLTGFNGETVEVYGAQLPDTYAVGDKLASNADGNLVTGSAAPYLEVTKIIGNKQGIEATVVAE